MTGLYIAAAFLVVAAVIPAIRARMRLSKAKHPSLQGHSRFAKWLSRLVPFYEYGEEEFFVSDGAPADVAAQRCAGFTRLARQFSQRAPQTIALGERLEPAISDLQFVT